VQPEFLAVWAFVLLLSAGSIAGMIALSYALADLLRCPKVIINGNYTPWRCTRFIKHRGAHDFQEVILK
jgi:hypothetical protein